MAGPRVAPVATTPIPLAPELCYLCPPSGTAVDGWLGRLITRVDGDIVHYISLVWPFGEVFAGALNCSKAVFRRWAKGGRLLTPEELRAVVGRQDVQDVLRLCSREAEAALRALLAPVTDQQLMAEATRRGLIVYDAKNRSVTPRVRTRSVLLDGHTLASE